MSYLDDMHKPAACVVLSNASFAKSDGLLVLGRSCRVCAHAVCAVCCRYFVRHR
jgi:hypothetical protein